MSNFSSRNIRRGIPIVALILIGIACYSCAAVLHDRTLVSWWIPASISLTLSLLSGLTMWRLWHGVTESGRMVINYICHVMFSCGIFLAAIYGLNYAFTQQSSQHAEHAIVKRKYTKTRHHQKRVSRRVYRQGSPYKVYYMELHFENGREKTIQVSSKRFYSIRSGSTIPLTVESGLFGIPVIKDRFN